MGNCYILVPDKSNEIKVVWATRCLLLLKMSARMDIGPANFTLLQIMECVDPFQSVEGARVYVRKMRH